MSQEDLNSDLRKNKFTVPDNYFETYDARLMERIHRAKPANRFRVYLKRWTIAASIVILAVSGWLVFRNEPAEKVDIANISIDETELEDFQNDADVNEEEFMELLNEQALDTINNIEVMAVSNVTFTDREIQDISEEYTLLDDEVEI